MSVEIRTYEGDFSDIADLVARTWDANFTGKTWFPLWDRDYFSWRLHDERNGPRDLQLAAYQGGKLVATILGECLDFDVEGERVKGSYSSFLSVDPTLKVPGVAIRLLETFRKRSTEQGRVLSLGVTSADTTLANRRFWDSLAKRRAADIQYLWPIRMWTRVLDGKAMAAGGMTSFERIGGRLAEFLPQLGGGSAEVRPYRPSDLARCLSWVQAQGDGVEVRHVWTEKRLEVQLGHAFPRTLVVEDGKGRGAFLNYYRVKHSARELLPVGMIDLFAGDTDLSHQLALLKAATEQMRSEGLALAAMMATAAAPAQALMTAAFVPLSVGADFLAVFPTRALPSDSGKYHVLFT